MYPTETAKPIMRILYIQATLVPPPVGGVNDRFLPLSDHIEGEILQPVWFRTPEEIEAVFGPGSYPVYAIGKFRYHWFPAYDGPREKSRFATFWFYVTKGWSLCRERKVDCIVVYSHMTTAVCAVLLKFLTGSRLITEVMIGPDRAYLTDRKTPGLKDRLRHLYSTICLYVTTLACNRVHLLYPGQLESYSMLRGTAASVFHDYTPVSGIKRHVIAEEDDANRPYIVLAGAPWYRKGADLAVEAFSRLSPDYPRWRLLIVGYFPEGTLQNLAAKCDRIEVVTPKPHAEMMRIVTDAEVMLLPSRNEGLPRILIEGMAAGLPLVGSDIAGIPVLIRDGENGFVVGDGDVDMLERRLRELLSDASLRRRMGQRSYEMAQATLTERVYVEQFTRMLHDTV